MRKNDLSFNYMRRFHLNILHINPASDFGTLFFVPDAVGRAHYTITIDFSVRFVVQYV